MQPRKLELIARDPLRDDARSAVYKRRPIISGRRNHNKKGGENSCHENFCDSDAAADWLLWVRCCRAGSVKLQGVRGPATRLHEKLCWPDVQIRVPNVHEILRQEIVKRRPAKDCQPP